MEVSSFFLSNRHQKNPQLQEPFDRSTPKFSLVKSHSLQKNTPLPSVDTDSAPHRGARRLINDPILELIDQKVAECKLHLANGSSPPSSLTSDAHSSTKVSSSIPLPSNADSEPTTSSFEQVEMPRQSPRFQRLDRPFSASQHLQGEEDLSRALSEPRCSSAERGSTSSRYSECSRRMLDPNGTEVKENFPGVNCEPTVHPRLNPASDHARKGQAKPIRVTPTAQRQIFPEVAVQAETLLCSKAAAGAVSPQNKPEGDIRQNPVVQMSVNPPDVGVSKLRRSPQPIVYEDISEDENEINGEKSPCPPELSDAEEDTGPCIVLDYDVEDDDDWEVLPLSIFDLRFQPRDKQTLLYDEEKESVLGSRRANLIPASAFTQMKVFDTPEQQKEAMKLGKVSFVIPSINEHGFEEVVSRRERSESPSDVEDCCDTEDSSDYSSGPDCNLMVVSLQCLKDWPSHEKKTKGKTTPPEKGLKAERQNHQTPVIVLDSSDESDDCMGLKEYQPAPNGCENNQMEHSKMDTHHDADENEVSCVGLHRTENYGQSTRDDIIIILSDSDDDSSATPTSKTTDRTSAASPNHNMTADSSAGFPEPGTVTEEAVTKKSETKRRARSPETQQLGINSADAEKSAQVKQAPPVKMAEKQHSFSPDLWAQKHPYERLQLLQGPSTHGQAEDRSMSNPTPTTVTCNQVKATQRAKKSVRSKPRPSSTASMVQRSVSSSVSSTSKTSHSSEERPSSSAMQPSNPAKSKVCSDWQKSYFSIGRKTGDRLERGFRTKASDLPAESRPQPGRVLRRQHPHESAPLMKKTKLRAIDLTRDRKCKTPADPRFPVGDGYKWKNPTQHGSKTRVGQPRTRQFSRSPFSGSSLQRD